MVCGISEKAFVFRALAKWLEAKNLAVTVVSLGELAREATRLSGGLPRDSFSSLAAGLARKTPNFSEEWSLVVGNSLGGTICIGAMAQPGQKPWAKKILLLDPPLTLDSEVLQLLQATMRLPAWKYLARILLRPWSWRDKISRALSFFQTKSSHMMLLAALEPVDVSRFSCHPDTRVKIIASDEEYFSFVTTAQRVELRDRPRTTLEALVGVSHDLWQETPELLKAEISDLYFCDR